MFDILIKDSKGNLLDTRRCEQSKCTIGRSGRNFIRLKGWRIAGSHAELSLKNDGVHLTDISAGIGTLVNGEEGMTFGPLQKSDEISIGSYRLSIVQDKVIATGVRQPSETLARTFLPQDSEYMHDQAAPVQIDQVGQVCQEDQIAQLDRTTLGVRQRPEEEEILEPSTLQHRFFWHKRIHQKLMNAMDLRRTDVESMNDAHLTETVKTLIHGILEEIDPELPPNLDRAKLAREVLNEAVGLGPLEDFLADDSITEIMVNHYDDIYYESRGKLYKSEVTFSSNDAVLSVIERIVSPLGRRIDESSPMVDGRLKDGSRINAIIPPLAIKGPCLTIRKFSKKNMTDRDLINHGSISANIVEFLRTAVANRKNIIISGGTGSGKTTFLNVLSSFIPHSDRIVTVEDSAELRLDQPHVVSLEARPPNMEGKGAVVIRDLVKNCLRMRPDRIVVGECRGGEALDMLQAMNTGHDGSLTTVHANNPRDLISRLEVMVMMAGMDLPEKAILEQIASAVHVVIQQSRFSDGTRKITHVTEITGMESGVVQMQDIFLYKQKGLDGEGKVVGSFRATGRVPEFYEDLKQRGLDVDLSLFKEA
jgi:pilus assembly protein CpaF